MAELKFKVVADLRKLKKDIKDTLSKKFNIGVSAEGGGGGVSGNKETKKQTGILKSIGGVGSIIMGLLMGMKPVMDLLKIGLNFIMFAILQLITKWLPGILDFLASLPGKIWEFMSGLPEKIWEFVKGLGAIIWGFMTQLPGMIWNFIKTLPGHIWEFVKGLGAIIWGFMVQLPGLIWNLTKGLGIIIWDLIKIGFNWIVKGLTLVWNLLKEGWKLISNILKLVWKSITWVGKFIWNIIKSIPGKIWNLLKTGFNWIKDKVVVVWNALKSLPGWIWEKMKELPALIGRALRGVFSLFGKKKRNKPPTTVGDAIIRPDGSIIHTDPKDTLIATKNPGGMGGTNVLNFYGVMPQEMIDIIKRELGTDVFKSSRF